VSSTTCTSCEGAQILTNDACVACSSGQGVQNNVCVSCDTFETVNSEGFCQKCDSGCVGCTNIPNNCTVCINGFYKDTNSACPQCDSNCITCSGGGPNDCTSESSFDDNFAGACTLTGEGDLACEVGCVGCDCDLTDNTTDCTQTLPGYTIDSNGDTFQCNVHGCRDCAATNLNVCTRCFEKFTLSSAGLCIVCDSSCFTCSSATQCTACFSNKFLDTVVGSPT
jgi:proprotein convertase subtilisin/kexin type 5